MIYRVPLSIITGVLCVAFFLLSCEKDDLQYDQSLAEAGTSPSQATINYHFRKENACLNSKRDLVNYFPADWANASLVIEHADGSFSLLPIRKDIFAKVTFNYESRSGGVAKIELANKYGFGSSQTLHPCNEKDAYFYIALVSPDGSAINTVVAFSTSEAGIPAAVDVGQGYGLAKGDRLAGVALPEGQTGTSLLDKLGNTTYLSYLVRQAGCTGWALPSAGNPPPSNQATLTCSNPTYEVNGWKSATNFITFMPKGRCGQYGNWTPAPTLILRYEIGGYYWEHEQLWISDSQLCSGSKVLVKAVKNGVTVLSYSAWVDRQPRLTGKVINITLAN